MELRVLKRVGAGTSGIEHNEGNSILQDGAKALGLPCLTVPQNTAGKRHSCGLCTFGCSSGEKLGTNTSFLIDAHQNGVVCLQNTKVERITFDPEKRVTGVKAVRKDGTTVVVTAPRVVVSAGAVRTPCLLQKSGVQNPHIGRNLKVHPMALVVGYFNAKRTNPWDGSILTSLVTAYEDKNTGSQSRIFNMNFWPANSALFLPWSDPLDFKLRYLRSAQSVWSVCMGRDRFTNGSINSDDLGEPIISYDLDARDQNANVEAMIVAAKIQLEAGCDEVLPLVDSGDVPFPPYIRASGMDFDAWVLELRAATKGKKTWTSGHPQGSCRMGMSHQSSVVSPAGKVWGHEGLYIADASVFPTCSGTNPMATVLAVAEWVARKLVKELEEEKLAG